MTNVQDRPFAGEAASANSFDAIVVGAGFAGMYMLHKLREAGFTARVLEAGTGVGGTWYWNRYPGARCDVESLDYQYAFSDDLHREWDWSERFATQPEILAYANHVADRFDLRRDMQFETRVVAADWDEAAARWHVRTEAGEAFEARFFIAATGCLSVARVPDFKGLDTFEGEWYHTGAWPHEGVDFAGKRVAVIGTGSSGIQSIPVIAEQAADLTVFQRTPNFSVPARNDQLTPEKVETHKANFQELRRAARESSFAAAATTGALEVDEEERLRTYQAKWDMGGTGLIGTFNDIIRSKEANDTAAEFVRSKIREIVKDPEIADALAPFDHPIGAKRICVDTNYYETYIRENVHLVNLRLESMEEITPKGIRTAEQEYEFDAIVFATGFDAMTGALLKMNITGKGGQPLADKWQDGPRTYLGLSMVGFPNLFTITGPGSPSVLSNMIISIEQHVEWITDCLVYLREHGVTAIEAEPDAENAWVEHVNAVADTTLYPQANSWYIGANIPGKPRVFMPYVGGVGPYGVKCKQVADAGYEGFALEVAEAARTTA